MGSEHYCLRWNNHQSNLLGVFSQLLQDQSLVDVTLACAEGHSIRAHKVVLSACSSYFQTLFLDHPNRHPIVILKDVRFAELRTLVEFMYKGEVHVEYCQLSTLLKTAESLKVKGLAEMTNIHSIQEEKNDNSDQQRITDMPLNSKKLVSENNVEDSSSRASISPGSGNKKTQQESTRSEVTCDEDTEEKNEEAPKESETSALIPRLSSPHSEPVPGPSGLPPVQQFPLSLKKEAEWDRHFGDDKSTAGESSSEFRHQQEAEVLEVGEIRDTHSPRIFSCMYCGAIFHYQSKLTRHILSHSLETLKYREQVHLQQQSLATLAAASLVEPLNVMDTRISGGLSRSHDLTSTDAHKLAAAAAAAAAAASSSPLEMDFSVAGLAELAAASVGSGNTTAIGNIGVGTGSTNGVMCKFCGKSFPDVSSLITHLPVHTGDRPFKCEFCGKAFKLRHHMKDHCRVHTGERPFRCSICGKTFSRSTILKAHEKTHFPKYVRNFLSPSPVDIKEESPHQ